MLRFRATSAQHARIKQLRSVDVCIRQFSQNISEIWEPVRRRDGNKLS